LSEDGGEWGERALTYNVSTNYNVSSGSPRSGGAGGRPGSCCRGGYWPIQDIVSCLGLCARINPILCVRTLCLGTPPHPVIAHTIAQYNVFPDFLLLQYTPHNIDNGSIVSRPRWVALSSFKKIRSNLSTPPLLRHRGRQHPRLDRRFMVVSRCLGIGPPSGIPPLGRCFCWPPRLATKIGGQQKQRPKGGIPEGGPIPKHLPRPLSTV